MSKRFSSLSARAESFRHAFRGLAVLFGTQPNMWIHASAAACVVVAGFAMRLTRLEWVAIVVAIGGVWVAEAFNTALEFLADAVSPEPHPRIGKAKDAAAAAVLVASIAAAVIGALVFLPRVLALWVP